MGHAQNDVLDAQCAATLDDLFERRDQRFTAVQTGQVDVLFRNTTWTQSRDTDVGMDFGPTTYFDGQQLMGRAGDGFSGAEGGNDFIVGDNVVDGSEGFSSTAVGGNDTIGGDAAAVVEGAEGDAYADAYNAAFADGGEGYNSAYADAGNDTIVGDNLVEGAEGSVNAQGGDDIIGGEALAVVDSDHAGYAHANSLNVAVDGVEGYYSETPAAGNDEMARMHRDVTERIRVIRRLDFTVSARIAATYDEHAAILAALADRRAAAAQRLLAAHIEASRREVRKITLEGLYEARAALADTPA